MPSYCPQFGARGVRQLQLAAGAVRAGHERRARVFHCDRRARVLLRDIFRFGTATVVTPSSSCPVGCLVAANAASAAQRGSICSCAWSGRQVVQPLPAARAQAGAVRPAQRRRRQGEHHRVTHHRFEVEQIAVDPVDLVRLGRLVRGAVRVGEQLADVDVQLLGDRVEAPPALAGHRRR